MTDNIDNIYLLETPLTSTVNQYLLPIDVTDVLDSFLLRELQQSSLTDTKNVFIEDDSFLFIAKKCKKKKRKKKFIIEENFGMTRKFLKRRERAVSRSRSISNGLNGRGISEESEAQLFSSRSSKPCGFSLSTEDASDDVDCGVGFGGQDLRTLSTTFTPPTKFPLPQYFAETNAENLGSSDALSLFGSGSALMSGSTAFAPAMFPQFGAAPAVIPPASCEHISMPFGSSPISQQNFRSSFNKNILRQSAFISQPKNWDISEMPEYNFTCESIEISCSVSAKFFHDDRKNFHIQRVMAIKSKKMLLLNGVSMALMCSAHMKDDVDPYRLFIHRCADAVRHIDPEFILKVALYARQELNIRSVSNFLLSFAAYHENTRPYIEKYYDSTIRLPSDWIEVADLYQTYKDKRLKPGSLPSSLKKVMHQSFKKFDDYQLAKYNRCKPKKSKKKKAASELDDDVEKQNESTPKCFSLKQLIRLLHIDSPAKEVMCLLGKKYPDSVEAFKKCGLSGFWDPKMAGKRMKLPQPVTWETQISANGNKPNVWEKIIDANKLPYMAMLRNIRNLILSGISQKHHDKVVKHLENKHAVMNSRQTPLQFYEAYKVISSLEDFLICDKDNVESSCSVAWKKKHLQKTFERMQNATNNILERYKKAVNKALEISALYNLSPIPGKTLIICDLSFPEKQKIKKSKERTYETCLMLGLMCKKACEHCKMDVIFHDFSDEVIFDANDDFLQVLINQCATTNWILKLQKSSNSLEGLEKVLRFYLKQQVILSEKLDHIVYLRVSKPKEASTKEMTSFLNKYRQTVNPNLLYTDVNLSLSIKSFSDIYSDEGKDLYLCGNSPQLIKFVAERSNDGQLTYVENIDAKYNLKNVGHFLLSKEPISEPMEDTNISVYSREPKWNYMRIFISSTFKDMHSERDMLIRFVMPELKKRAATLFVKVNEVDLRWGINDADCSTKRTAELCILEAQRADLFIGILGERYGTVYNFGNPEHAELQWLKDYPQNLSITELEMHAGALRKEKRVKKKAFFYFRNSSCLGFVPDKWREHFTAENPESKTKLDELKSSIRRSGLKVLDGYGCKFAGVLNGKPILSGLDIFGKTVLEDLWNVIKQEHAKVTYLDPVTEEEENQKNVSHYFDSFIGERNSQAENLLKKIKKEYGIFLITGTPGSGKTTFMINLLKKLNNFTVIKFFVGLTPRSTDVHYMLQFLSESIARKLPICSLFPHSPKDVMNNFPDILQEAINSGEEFILFIDGLDYLKSNDQLLDWLPLSLPDRLRLVCSASESCLAFKLLLERQAYTDKFHVKKLFALPQSDREAIVTHYLSLYGKTLDESSFNNQMLLMVTKKDSGLPLYLRTACDFLRTYATFENFTSMLQNLPTSAVLLLQEIIIQMENEYGPQLVQTALTLLCITNEGLNEKDLHVLLSVILMKNSNDDLNSFEEIKKNIKSLNPCDFLPHVTFHSLLHLICSFSYGHSRSFNLNLAGSELEKAVKKYYLNRNYFHFEKRMHLLLAAFYYTLCDSEYKEEFVAVPGSAVRGLLHHLLSGKCLKELSVVLCNLKFLELCFLVNSGEILLEYYDSLLEGKQYEIKELNLAALKSFQSFITRNLHILTEHPKLIYQQALNEPEESLVKLDPNDVKSSMVQCVCQPNMSSDHRLSTLGGFIKPITAISCHENKSIAALGSNNGYLKILDFNSKKIIRNLKGHSSTITSISFGGKNRICTASNDNTLNIWSSEDFSLISVLKGHRHFVTCCCTDPAGDILLSSSWDSSVRLWSLHDGRSISVIDNFRSPINCIAHHPLKQQVACGLWNGHIEIWDTVALKRIITSTCYYGSVKSVAYSPDGINVVTSFINSDIAIWSAEEGLKLSNLRGHILPVQCIAFSHERNMIVSGSEDCTLKVWPTETGVFINSLTSCRFCPISKLELLSHDTIVVVFQNSEVYVMNILTDQNISKFSLKSDMVTCISKPSVTSTSKKNKDKLWFESCVILGTHSGQILIGEFYKSSLALIGRMKSSVTGLDHCADLIACGDSDGNIGVFYYPNYNSSFVYGVHRGSVLSIKLFKSSPWKIMSTGYEKIIRLWEIGTDEDAEIKIFEEISTKHNDGIISCCGFEISENDWTLSGSHDNTVRLNVENKETMLTGLKTSVINVGCTSKYIIGCASDGSLAMWSKEGKLVSYIPGIEHSSAVLSFFIEKDLTDTFDVTFAYADKDGSVKISKPIQKLFWFSLEGHSKSITSCCILKEGEIVSSSLDGTINFWKVTLDSPDKVLNHKASITGILIYESDNVVISSDVLGNVSLWKLDKLSNCSRVTCASRKSYTGGFIKSMIWSGNNSFIIAVTQVKDDKEIHFLDILSFEQTSSDEQDTYNLRVMNSYMLESEVLCFDASLENETIVVSFKSGKILVITADQQKIIPSNHDWIVGTKLIIKENCVKDLYLLMINGKARCFSLVEFLKKVAVSFANMHSGGDSLYVSAFYCKNESEIFFGDTEGYLKGYVSADMPCKKVHDNIVTGIVVIGSYIFTCSLDKTVKGWMYSSLEQVCQYHTSVPITSLTGQEILDEDSKASYILIIGTISGGIELLKFHPA